MHLGRIHLLMIWLATLVATGMLAHSSPARANDIFPDCFVDQPVEFALDEAFANWRDWECSDAERDLAQGRVLLRFELADEARQQLPAYLVSRASKFTGISIAIDGDAGLVEAELQYEDLAATYFDRQFLAPIPEYSGSAEVVLVAITEPTQASTIDYARLVDQAPGITPADRDKLMLIAMIAGMILMPLLFDFVFFRVLRESFILWHAALVLSMAMLLASTSGLYLSLFEANLPLLRLITVGSFNMMVFSGIMFSIRFVEPGKIAPGLRTMLVGAMWAFTIISCIHGLGISAFGRWPAMAYFIVGLPLSILMFWMLGAALLRGSIAARYLAFGIGPLVMVALIRVLSYIAPGIPTTDANQMLLFATLVEAGATALGVASRFLTLKLDRDRARAEKEMLEELAERDPLTGLMNRRAIENCFQSLRLNGYSTIAVLDIDHFKQVNDEHGHHVGDKVLQAVGKALSADKEALAVRLGGEEFMLLLKGHGRSVRAENLRTSIPTFIGENVGELDRPVTASMGLVDIPHEVQGQANFADLYERADRLLYVAKAGGRNRTVKEKITLFKSRRRADRRHAA